MPVLVEVSEYYDITTQAPTSSENQETEAFEALIKKVGEGKARWTQIMRILEENEK